MSANGRPVEGEEVKFYADDVLLGGNSTNGDGQYNISIAVPCDMTAGTYQVYAVYSPSGCVALGVAKQ